MENRIFKDDKDLNLTLQAFVSAKINPLESIIKQNGKIFGLL
jgi:hypothetical protein